MATKYDIGFDPITGPVFIGTAVTITFTLTPTGVDTTGWTTQVTFKKNTTDTVAIKTYTPVQSTTGLWSITMSKADTLLFATPGTYQYDFERIDVGSEAVMTYGQINFQQKVL